jgi:hypothetical protein
MGLLDPRGFVWAKNWVKHLFSARTNNGVGRVTLALRFSGRLSKFALEKALKAEYNYVILNLVFPAHGPVTYILAATPSPPRPG